VLLPSKRVKWAGQVACTGHVRNEYAVIAKPEEKRSLENTRSWDSNIKMNLKDFQEGLCFTELVLTVNCIKNIKKVKWSGSVYPLDTTKKLLGALL
jgi:hypothetical protein